MLYVVGHHRGGAAQDIDAKIAIGERRECLMRGCGREAGAGIWAQWVLEGIYLISTIVAVGGVRTSGRIGATLAKVRCKEQI